MPLAPSALVTLLIVPGLLITGMMVGRT